MNEEGEDDLECRAAIEARVRSAFPVDPIPSSSELIEKSEFRDLESEEIGLFLSGMSWADLTLNKLFSYKGDASAILALISREAFKYYFPAFLLMGLKEHDDAGRVFTTAIDAFLPSFRKDRQLDKWIFSRTSAFSKVQLETSRDAFEFIKLHDSDFLEVEEIDGANQTIELHLGQLK